MKKLLFTFLFSFTCFLAIGQNYIGVTIGNSSGSTKKYLRAIDGSDRLVFSSTGVTPVYRWSDFTGTGTSLATWNANGDFVRITNGSNGDFLTLTAGVPTWTSGGFVPDTRTITIAGTANEITSSAGAQDLIANRTWTLSLPSALTFTGKTITGGTYASGAFNGTIGATTPSTGVFTTVNVGNLSLATNSITESTGNDIQIGSTGIILTADQTGDDIELYANTSGGIITAEANNGIVLTGASNVIQVDASGVTLMASQTNDDVTITSVDDVIVNATGDFALTKTTNQLVLGTTNTTTISSTAPSASRVYTIPDNGSDANFALQTYATFTPELADASTGGNLATGTFSGEVLKTGRQVVINMTFIDINTTGMTGANDIFIRNLQYPNGSISANGSIDANNLTFVGFLSPRVAVSDTFLRIGEVVSGAVVDNVIVSEISSGVTDLRISVTYITN